MINNDARINMYLTTNHSCHYIMTSDYVSIKKIVCTVISSKDLFIWRYNTNGQLGYLDSTKYKTIYQAWLRANCIYEGSYDK